MIFVFRFLFALIYVFIFLSAALVSIGFYNSLGYLLSSKTDTNFLFFYGIVFLLGCATCILTKGYVNFGRKHWEFVRIQREFDNLFSINSLDLLPKQVKIYEQMEQGLEKLEFCSDIYEKMELRKKLKALFKENPEVYQVLEENHQIPEYLKP